MSGRVYYEAPSVLFGCDLVGQELIINPNYRFIRQLSEEKTLFAVLTISLLWCKNSSFVDGETTADKEGKSKQLYDRNGKESLNADSKLL